MKRAYAELLTITTSALREFTMQNYPSGSRHEIVTLEDFTMIEDVFQELLQERQLDQKSDEAETLAARLIELYRSGIHDQAALKQMASYI